MIGLAEDAGRLSGKGGVRRQDRHPRCANRAKERFDPPVEFVVPDDPGVVAQEIEELDHSSSLISEPKLGALINVSDIEEERIWTFATPGFYLGCAAREATEVGMPVVIDCRQDMAVQVGGVQET